MKPEHLREMLLVAYLFCVHVFVSATYYSISCEIYYKFL